MNGRKRGRVWSILIPAWSVVPRVRTCVPARLSPFRTPTICGNCIARRVSGRISGRNYRKKGKSGDELEVGKDKVSRDCRRVRGVFLVTGPTGSGKTTTLYAALSRLDRKQKNIITVEDPIEYQLSGVGQIQVNSKIDLTFANGLRSILRQDPDVIMVGEIRDQETAEIAIQSALTGHMVFSTLHTNDAAGGLTRLVEMGIEPFLAASSVVGILAQRLVRSICPHCRETYTPETTMLERLNIDPGQGDTFYRGRGCVKCMDIGYRGRTGVYELLSINEKIRAAILANADAGTIRTMAIEGGMTPLRNAGLELARQGVTTLEEVIRVTQEEN